VTKRTSKTLISAVHVGLRTGWLPPRSAPRSGLQVGLFGQAEIYGCAHASAITISRTQQQGSLGRRFAALHRYDGRIGLGPWPLGDITAPWDRAGEVQRVGSAARADAVLNNCGRLQSELHRHQQRHRRPGFLRRLSQQDFRVRHPGLAHYVRTHKSLRTAPAMAAGVEGSLWSMQELVKRMSK
jgi:hypothetical protein